METVGKVPDIERVMALLCRLAGSSHFEVCAWIVSKVLL